MVARGANRASAAAKVLVSSERMGTISDPRCLGLSLHVLAHAARSRVRRSAVRNHTERARLTVAAVCRGRYSDETEFAVILSALRDTGFAFAGAAAGWPPAEVFRQLREGD